MGNAIRHCPFAIPIDPTKWDSDAAEVLAAKPGDAFIAARDIFADGSDIEQIDNFACLALARPDCYFVAWFSSITLSAETYLRECCGQMRLAMHAARFLRNVRHAAPKMLPSAAEIVLAEVAARRTLPNLAIAWRVPASVDSWPAADVYKALSMPVAERYLWIDERSGFFDAEKAMHGKQFVPLGRSGDVDTFEAPERRCDWVIVDTPNPMAAKWYTHCAIESGLPFFVTYKNAVPEEQRLRLYPVSWRRESEGI